MLRLLCKDDVKEEYRDKVVRLVHCPVLQRVHSALMCLACSRKQTCEVSKNLGISELEAEDVVYDSDFFKKATHSRKAELDAVTSKSRKGTSAKKRKKEVDISEKRDEHKAKVSSSPKKVKGGKAMRGDKKKAVLEFLKANPSAKAGEIRKACGVSYVYATKVLQQFRQAADQPQDAENPPQD